MSKNSDSAPQAPETELFTILKIAAHTAKQTLVWVTTFFVFLGGTAAVSVGIALISTTAIGGAVSVILVFGLTGLPSKRVRNGFQPAQ